MNTSLYFTNKILNFVKIFLKKVSRQQLKVDYNSEA